jgi:hypothetical protein
VALLLACGDGGRHARQPVPVRTPLVATERSARGGVLVLIDENGTRQADLTKPLASASRDNSPAWSPDGQWVVFASSRGRPLTETSLWIVRARSGVEPVRLTGNGAVDRDPVFSPDGKWLVFASNRGGTFDLWRAPLRTGRDGRPRLVGPEQRLTETAGHELGPSFAPDGQRLVYTALSADSARSTLWLLSLADRAQRQLTEGPADITPAWSPDGRRIAFAAPAPGRRDADLYLVAAGGGDRRVVIDEPLADETGPRWSSDGRFLFATAVYRSLHQGRPVLGSVVVVELAGVPPVLRALHDPAVVESRLGVAVAPGGLRTDRLRANAPYRRALRLAIDQQLTRAAEELRRRVEESGDRAAPGGAPGGASGDPER